MSSSLILRTGRLWAQHQHSTASLVRWGVSKEGAAAPASAAAAFSSTTLKHQHSEPFYGSPRPPRPKKPSHIMGFLADSIATIVEQMSSHVCVVGTNSRRTTADRIALTLRQASIAIRDPTRADAVAAVGELTGTLALERLQTFLQNHPIGRIILYERPLVSKGTIPYEELLQQARDTQDVEYANLTFGQAYGRFLLLHGFDPDERDEVRYITDNEELAYIMLRYRQSHDFYHALTGLPPTVLGELALKWLEFWQTGLPMTALAGVVASQGTLNPQERSFLWNTYVPWAQRMGHDQMEFGTLLSVYYEQEWNTPLKELQQRMGIQEMAPIIPTTLGKA